MHYPTPIAPEFAVAQLHTLPAADKFVFPPLSDIDGVRGLLSFNWQFYDAEERAASGESSDDDEDRRGRTRARTPTPAMVSRRRQFSRSLARGGAQPRSRLPSSVTAAAAVVVEEEVIQYDCVFMDVRGVTAPPTTRRPSMAVPPASPDTGSDGPQAFVNRLRGLIYALAGRVDSAVDTDEE